MRISKTTQAALSFSLCLLITATTAAGEEAGSEHTWVRDQFTKFFPGIFFGRKAPALVEARLQHNIDRSYLNDSLADSNYRSQLGHIDSGQPNTGASLPLSSQNKLIRIDGKFKDGTSEREKPIETLTDYTSLSAD